MGHSLRALDTLIHGYPAIRLHLEHLVAAKGRSESKSKAIGFLKLLRSKDIISMVLFLHDVLTVLKKVSLKFQEEGSVVADVSLTVKTAITRIKSFAETDGPSLQKLQQFETCELPTVGATTRTVYKLTAGRGLLDMERIKIVDSLISALGVRFEDTSTNVVQATSLANFRVWPVREEELGRFGDDMINILIEQFKCYLNDCDGIKAEWPLLRSAVFDTFSSDFETLTWQQVNRRFATEYPHILNLFDLVLTIPATSTACERGFSQMKIVKSDHRTVMKEKTLSDSLMISLESPSIKDFNPDEAIDIWFNKCSWRPGSSQSQENRSAAEVVNDVLTELTQDEEVDNNGEEGNVEEPELGEDLVNEPNAGYELVEEDDSDYNSDYNSDEENENEIFALIAKY